MMDERTAPRTGTDHLLHRLAQEAGRREARHSSIGMVLLVAMAVALAMALAVVIALVGARANLPTLLGNGAFLFKVTAMILLAGGCATLVRAAAIPGMMARPALAVMPATGLLLAGLLLDRSGLPWMGAHPPLSATTCVGVIIGASLPALGLIMSALRCGIPTRLRQAGFFAGLLAGSLGALAYTVACVNDGAAFVVLWYPIAVLIVGGIGSLIGARWLAW